MAIFSNRGEPAPSASQSGRGGGRSSNIVYCISKDGGKSWVRKGKIISGREAQPSVAPQASGGTGAGNPSAILVKDYVYLFFNDSVSMDGAFKGKNQLCLAKAKLNKDGNFGPWMKFYQGSFSQAGIGGLCSQIMENPESINGIRYSNNADISFNTELKSYLLVVNSDDGFFYSTSKDLINWLKPVVLMQNPPRVNALKTPDATYYYYPTLITPSSKSDQETGKSGFLFYAKGVQDKNLSQSKHSWFRRSFVISEGQGY